MATLAQRITDLAAAIRDKFNAINPRLVATGGITGYVYTKTPTGHGWAESVGGGGGGGSSNLVVSVVATNTTMESAIDVYLASGLITLTLPSAAENTGVVFHVKNTGNSEITIAGTVDGDSSLILQYNNSAVTLVSSGTSWSIF